MSSRITKTLLGVGLGLLGNLIGFALYGLAFSQLNNVSFSYFYTNYVIDSDVLRSQIITGAILINVLLFYYLMRTHKDELSRGVLVVILLSVIAIVYYYA